MQHIDVSLLAVTATADEDSQELIVVIMDVTNTISIMLRFLFLLRDRLFKYTLSKFDL